MNFKERILQTIYPPRCFGCGQVVMSGEYFCKMCEQRYRLICSRKCGYCGNDVSVCDCTKESMAHYGVWRLSKLCAYLPYDPTSPLKRMLARLKKKPDKRIREFLSAELEAKIRAKCENTDDYTLCFVPRASAELRKSGFDHMHSLADMISKKLGIRCERMFARHKDSAVQKQLFNSNRFDNAQKNIELSDGVDARGKRFILLDDVCVSGASMGRCASLLIAAGAVEVRCFVIAVRP